MGKIDISVKVPDSGLIKQALGQLADRPRRSILISTSKKALKPMVAEIKQRTPVKSGDLRRSIGTSVRRGAKSYFADVVLAPRTRGTYNGWYAHIVEGGARGIVKNKGKSIIGKGKRYRKDIQPQPFFVPGVKSKIAEAEKIFIKSMNQALESRIKRLQRAAKKQENVKL